MIGNRTATAGYWVAAVVLSVLAGVAGAGWGNGIAPSFDNDDKGGTPATSASRLLFSIFGGLLCALGVLAVFAAIFMVLWLRARRRAEFEEVENDESFIDDIEFGDDDDDDGMADESDDDYDDEYDLEGDYDESDEGADQRR